jgi:hypothetical protein
MPKKVITTVGTSIFTNYMKKEVQDDLDGDYCSINKEFDEIEKKSLFAHCREKGKEIQSDINHVKDQISVVWFGYSNEDTICAEIKSLIKIAEEEGDLEVILLATDTVLSVLACELIVDWFKINKDKYPSVKTICFKREEHVIKGLQVKDANKFQTTGFQELIKLLKNSSDKNTIFNISGGYKAIIPFVTLYGQLENIPLKYIYEESDSLLTVSSLPINFDWEIAQTVTQYLSISKDDTQVLTTENDILIELEKNAVIYKNHTGHWKVSPLGVFLSNYVQEKSSVAKGTLGLFLEYKFYEYFCENSDAYYQKPQKLDLEYFIHKTSFEIFDMNKMKEQYQTLIKREDTHQTIKHRIKDIDSDLTTMEEIDLIFNLKSDENKKVACEIKSLKELSGAGEQLKKDIIAFDKTFNKYPDELLVLFYKVKFQVEANIDFQEDATIKKTILGIQKKINDFTRTKGIASIPLRVMATHIDLTNSFKVNYKSLLRKSINPKWVYNEPVI